MKNQIKYLISSLLVVFFIGEVADLCAQNPPPQVVIIIEDPEGRVGSPQLEAEAVTLSPNPATNYLTVSTIEADEILNISIRDLSGKSITLQSPDQWTGSRSIRLGISSLPQNIYLISVQTTTGWQSLKWVKI